MKSTKISRRKRRKAGARSSVRGTSKRPRVSVFRSNRALFVQFIDDEKRVTLLGEDERQTKMQEKNNVKRAFQFGKNLALEAQKRHISRVVFDRSGYAYHGLVKALAEGLREGGLTL